MSVNGVICALQPSQVISHPLAPNQLGEATAKQLEKKIFVEKHTIIKQNSKTASCVIGCCVFRILKEEKLN